MRRTGTFLSARFARARHPIAAVALLLCMFNARLAHADAASDARDHYDRAIKFYEDGAYDAALVELTRAYDLRPSFRLMYNIGQARLAMRDYAGAIEAFQRYLREGGGQVTNERVAAVRSQLIDLQQSVGTLTVETDVPGSEVMIDDMLIGTAPLSSPLVVNAGLRRVTVRHPDYPVQSQRVGVAGGEQHRVSLSLRPRAESAEPSTAPGPTPQPLAAGRIQEWSSTPAPIVTPEEVEPLRATKAPEPMRDEPDRTLAYVGTGLTAALVAGATVLGAITLNKNGDLEDRRDDPGADRKAFDEDRKDLRTLANITDGLGIAAIAVAGVTTWLWLSGGDAPPDQTARSHARPRVGVALAATGARLAGEF